MPHSAAFRGGVLGQGNLAATNRKAFSGVRVEMTGYACVLMTFKGNSYLDRKRIKISGSTYLTLYDYAEVPCFRTAVSGRSLRQSIDLFHLVLKRVRLFMTGRQFPSGGLLHMLHTSLVHRETRIHAAASKIRSSSN